MKKSIDYLFCTSTLLEGVNLPAKNIFILSNAIGSTKFNSIDFWNLAGRAGRLTKELSGNIICLRYIDQGNKWKNPERDLEVLKNKTVKEINPIIISGEKNFFKNIKNAIENREYTNKQATEGEKSYGTVMQILFYFINLKIHHLY